MAYLVFIANGQEFDRREIVDGAVIGRALDCAISIHDILLSRHHCRVEKTSNGWQVVDLNSRNGTMLLGRQIKRHTFQPGDRIRIGRTYVTFHEGAFVPMPAVQTKRASRRPIDPNEAMAGTVSGFQFLEPDEVERPVGMPFPKPRPKEPSSFRDDNVYEMLDELMSSSWDSIMSETSRPLVMQRVAPRPIVGTAPRVRSKPRVDISLQVQVEPARPARKLKSIGVFVCSAIVTMLIVGSWAMNRTPVATASAQPVVVAGVQPQPQLPSEPVVETPLDPPAEMSDAELIFRLAMPMLLSH